MPIRIRIRQNDAHQTDLRYTKVSKFVVFSFLNLTHDHKIIWVITCFKTFFQLFRQISAFSILIGLTISKFLSDHVFSSLTRF